MHRLEAFLQRLSELPAAPIERAKITRRAHAQIARGDAGPEIEVFAAGPDIEGPAAFEVKPQGAVDGPRPVRPILLLGCPRAELLE